MSHRFFVSTHAEGRSMPIAIDLVMADGRSMINKETQAEIEVRYPNVKIMTSEEFQELQELHGCTEPEEITEERYIEMLEVLPPMNWQNGGGAESFMMSEFLTGRITGIYCRIGREKYYSFNGICTMTHDEIVTKCMKGKQAK